MKRDISIPSLKIYNSLSGEKELFKPINPKKVGMYVCGPTLYDEVHLGNYRCFISFDIIFRYLRHLGYQVRYVRNITDVGHLEDDLDEGEDKVLKKARSEKIEPMEIVERYRLSFHEALRELNVLPPSIEPRASGHILEQIELIERLLSKGLAYEVNGSVYFDLEKYANSFDYGILSRRNIKDLIFYTRELKGKEEKKKPQDFALWKRAYPKHIMRWRSPWGEGFPGWHLECSAMGEKYLGEQFDIHGGGIDLKFPHHECEIAQMKGVCGVLPSRYWVHSNMLSFKSNKMSKSKGNVLYPRAIFKGESLFLEKAFDPMVVRFFILQAHYRSQLDFSPETLIAAEKSYLKLVGVFESLEKIKPSMEKTSNFDINDWIEACYNSLDDDFNTPLLIAQLFKIPYFLSDVIQGKSFLNKKDKDLLKDMMVIFLFDVLGLKKIDHDKREPLEKTQELIDFLLSLREKAREEKNWELSDQIRLKLSSLGIELKDKKI